MPHDQPTPTDARGQSRDVQLSAMVPGHIRRAVRLRAEQEGLTVRGLLLRLIRDAGIAEIDDGDLVDRRTSPGAGAPSRASTASGQSR